MATVDPHAGSDVDGQVTRFHETLMSALRAAIERTAKRLDPLDPVHSSSIMRTFWQSKVPTLLNSLESVVDGAASETRGRLQLLVTPVAVNAGGDLLRAQLKAAGRRAYVKTRAGLTADAFEIPTPAELFSEIYLRSRERFIVNLGTDAWNDIKLQLIDGMNAGEGFPELRARVTSVADMQQSNAERIARTEVVGAINAGAIEQVRASKLDATKTWLATNDGRTRQSHRDVNGTTVRLDETFLVGGIPMDRPHDPAAPADEVIQCRCTLTFEIPEDAITAAAFGKPDQQRDYHGRWGKGGTKGSALTGDEALEHVKDRTKTVGYDQYDRKIAIMDYADSGYGPINDGLRRTRGNVSELDGKRPDQVKELDAIFADTSGIEKPIAVYRGMLDYKNIFNVSDGKELVGKTLTDQGFLSTSTERSVASNFAFGGNAAVFTIHAPVGTQAVHVGKATNIAKKDEAEILFNRGSSLKITKVTTGSDGTLDVEAEL